MSYHNKRLEVAIIKEAINPYEFYLKEQDLDRYEYRSGAWAVAGRCPFHADIKPGSFKINTETGSYKCWSCGESGGDIITFLQQRDDLNFVDALEQLTREWEVSTC